MSEREITLPRRENFRRLTNSFRLTSKEKTSVQNTDIVQVAAATDGNLHTGQQVRYPPIFMTYDKLDSLSFNGFKRSVKQKLEPLNHPANDRIIHSLCAISAVEGATGNDAFNVFNEFFSGCCLSKVFHFIGVGMGHHGERLDWNGLKIGRIDNEKLRHWCKRSGSNFYDLYQESINSLSGLESEWRDAPIIDFHQLLVKQKSREKDSILRRLVLEYFEAINEIHIEEMWEAAYSENSIYDAAENNCFDTHSFHSAPIIQKISVYNWKSQIGNAGFVVPTGTSINCNWVDSESVITTRAKAFRDKFGIDKFGNQEVHKLIRLFSLNLAEATRTNRLKNFEGAVLKCFTALELVFAERSGISASVARRASVVMSPADGTSQSRIEQQILKLYGVRSQYVHEGTKAGDSHARTVLGIKKNTLFCLLTLQLLPQSKDNHFLEKWREQLDWIYLSHKVGHPPNPDQLSGAGLNYKIPTDNEQT